MALITCLCGEQIDDSARFCPHCGHRNQEGVTSSVVEPILYESIIFSPPRNLPLMQRPGVGKFGVRRWKGTEQGNNMWRKLRFHKGIDLYSVNPNDNEEVYSVTWGRVESISDDSSDREENGITIHIENWSVTIRHHPYSSGYLTWYTHLKKPEPDIVEGKTVTAGQLIGYVSPDPYPDDPHLHFEWHRLADPSLNEYVFWLDPTPLLYRFEAEGWPSDPQGSLEPIARHRHNDYKQIGRIRVLPWRFKHEGSNFLHHSTWLFEVIREGEEECFYLPLYGARPHEELMIGILRDAFKSRAKVKLRWRDSFFFGERSMIEDVRVRPG